MPKPDTTAHYNKPKNLTIYTRDGCHLCEQVTASLYLFQKEFNFKLHFVYIDEDPTLVEKYNADVPVVMLDNTVLFRHFFDEDKLRQALVHG